MPMNPSQTTAWVVSLVLASFIAVFVVRNGYQMAVLDKKLAEVAAAVEQQGAVLSEVRDALRRNGLKMPAAGTLDPAGQPPQGAVEP